MYFKFAVPEKGFPKKLLKELKKWMKTWPRFYAAFHDEKKAIVPLKAGGFKRTRYWMEVSDKPLRKRKSYYEQLKTEKKAKMREHLKPFRG